MSQTKEIEIANRSPSPQRPHLNNYNGHNGHKHNTNLKQNKGNDQTPHPNVPNFTKKQNGSHIEIKPSKNENINDNHKTSTSSPIRDQTKSIVIEDVKSLKAEGDRLFNESRYQEALIQYKLALNYLHYNPEFESNIMVINKSIYTKVLSNIGQCLSKLDKQDEAIVSFSQAIKLDPYNIKAYYRLAYLFNKKNDINRACETLKKGMAYIPDINDDQLRKFFTDYYNYTLSLQNSQLSGLKSRMKSYYSQNKAQKKVNKGIFTKAMLSSLLASSLTTGCIVYARNYNVNTALVALPANFLLWQVILHSEDRKKRYLALIGLIGINIAVWKFL